MTDMPYLESDMLFTVYANAQLRDNVEDFHHLIDFLRENGDFRLEHDDDCVDGYGVAIEMTVSDTFEQFVKLIAYFGPDVDQACAKRGECRTITSLRDQFEAAFEKGQHSLTYRDLALSDGRIFIQRDKEAAFEAAYGYLDGYCWAPDEDAPGWYTHPCAGAQPILSNTDIDNSFFDGPDRLKCYECYQLGFIEILNQIVAGVAFDEIPDLFKLIDLAMDWNVRHTTTDERGRLSFDQFWKDLYQVGGFKSGPDPEYPLKHTVNLFIMSLIADSLGGFLLNHDRKTLHKCRVCGKFFIGHANATACPSPRDCRNISSNS
ncbi:conserved hypothetical protein [delta proteobacterium NaphS2]|nr:conserved hypothetical protein [delta proteobacterium NaphS2]